MAARLPLVLNGIVISESKPGDFLATIPRYFPIFNRNGTLTNVLLRNGPSIPVTKRDNTIINITLDI